MATAAQIEIVNPPASRFTPEFDLLCACCRPGARSSIEGALEPPLDWERVLQLAAHHRVLPALWTALQNRRDLPASMRSAIGARFASRERRVLRFSAELAGVLRQFDVHQIPVMPYKGAILSQLLYGDPAMRDFGDLDFLVQVADVPRATAALRELGFEPKLHLSPRCERELLRTGYELVFGSGRERNLVELHWQVLPRFYATPFQIEEIFARSRETQFEGCRIRVPRNEDLFLMLCAHAAKHEWSHLGMVRDIAALASMDLDWPWIAVEATRLGILKILRVSLLLVRDLLQLDRSAVLPSSQLISECAEITIRLAHSLDQAETPDVESSRYFHFMMQLRERWQDRARFAWRLASTPSIGEWEMISIPDSLFPLYRGVRVVRLARRFMAGKKQLRSSSS